jgi:hypothetical protein
VACVGTCMCLLVIELEFWGWQTSVLAGAEVRRLRL